ncbi:MAG: AI-2E family transporter, partial [Bryobacteraceae bacterium]
MGVAHPQRTHTMARSSPLPSSTSPSHVLPLIAFILSIAALYFAKPLLIPMALAALLTFLLTPVAKFLERCRLGRVPSVLIALILAVSSIGAVGWVVSKQLLNVINQLPAYRENIQRKLEAIHGSKGDIVTKTTNSVQELTKELTTTPPNQPAQVSRETARKTKAAPALTTGLHPVPVEVVAPTPSTVQSLRNVAGPLIAPLGTALIVIVFATFMLMKREDLRSRFIRLVAKGHLNLMTQALDDVEHRVSRYLLMQFIVNAAYGTLIATGLYFIGVPNALLWGALAGTLRFIPYVGPLIGGALPFLLALAVFEGWTRPILTVGLFVVIELTTGNVIEPWLYGAH